MTLLFLILQNNMWEEFIDIFGHFFRQKRNDFFLKEISCFHVIDDGGVYGYKKYVGC